MQRVTRRPRTLLVLASLYLLTSMLFSPPCEGSEFRVFVRL
jgi:hypothetical protein